METGCNYYEVITLTIKEKDPETPSEQKIWEKWQIRLDI